MPLTGREDARTAGARYHRTHVSHGLRKPMRKANSGTERDKYMRNRHCPGEHHGDLIGSQRTQQGFANARRHVQYEGI